MGRLAARSSAHPPVALVESNQVVQARIAHALRALPVGTRYTLHDANLRELFSDSVFHVVEIRFTRITLSAEPAPTTGTDVTLVTNDDTPWRQRLSRSEQQVMLAALTRVHQHFLALAGQGDTVAFAAMLVARDATGRERVLALRDRYGRLLTE